MFALAGSLPARQRQALAGTFAAMAAVIMAAAIHTLFGVGGSRLDAPTQNWASCAVYVLVAGIVVFRAFRIAEARAAWVMLAVGISLYAAGNLVWSLWLGYVANPPIPSISDALWLALYPMSYVGIALLARHHWRGIPAGVWLDGIVGGLGIACVGAALVLGPVLASATGSRSAVATNLAYPIADLVLTALVVGAFSLRGWHLDRTWALLGAGFLVLSVADSLVLLQVAANASSTTQVANLFYMAAVAMIALAAWQRPGTSDVARTEGLSSLLVPAAFALAALGVLGYDHFVRVDLLALVLALLTVLAALLRTALAFRDRQTFNETRRQAVTDDLTGLPNRRLFQSRLEEAIARSALAGHGMAVLIVDLDRFKELNDTLGHASGDELLRQVGPRLARVLQPSITLARLGGDEFGIVVDTPSGPADALRIADRIRDVLGEPFDVQDLSLQVGASVGIALFPAHADTAGELMRRADVAMYQAKSAHSGRELYASERDTHSRDRLTLAADLERALRRDEIEVHFQPKADCRTGRVVGVEALARWRHPVLGLLQPDVFVPLAENTGLVRPLTRRVTDLALAQCNAWHRAGFDLRVSVNVAVADLLDVDLPGQILAALERHELSAGALVIEITESSLFWDPVRIKDVLTQLEALGVLLSLDDFGTGFSSLGHLKTLPVGEIKIDRSFVAQMTTNSADSAIVHATIQLAQRLGKCVVAEGVEDYETWKQLADAGCHLVQGYALSRALPAAELAPLLAELAVRQAA